MTMLTMMMLAMRVAGGACEQARRAMVTTKAMAPYIYLRRAAGKITREIPFSAVAEYITLKESRLLETMVGDVELLRCLQQPSPSETKGQGDTQLQLNPSTSAWNHASATSPVSMTTTSLAIIVLWPATRNLEDLTVLAPLIADTIASATFRWASGPERWET